MTDNYKAGETDLDLLTVKQVAELAGCTERTIRRKIVHSEMIADEVIGINNKKQYMVNACNLPEEIKNRYYAKLSRDCGLPAIVKKDIKKVKRTFDQFTDAEREQIRKWTYILENWQIARSKFENKTQADEMYISSLKLEYGMYFNVSTATLYRKWAAYKNNDLDELVENRGGYNKGNTSIPKEVWNWFLVAYLDQRQLPINQCYELSKQYAREFCPEVVPIIPHYITFVRKIKSEIPKAVVIAGREGDKAFSDRAAPYITRIYDELLPNEYWVADNHTLDIISRYDDKETTHRLSLTALIDARSGVMVGWNLTDNPCSQSTVLAFRHAILRFGLPDNAYFDNGSEFLTLDLAGRGHRSRKSQSLVDNPPPIFDRLKIRMTNAIVRNAKAKPIERTFNTFKGTISRIFDTFCGGNVLERPENLKVKLKNGNVPTDSSIKTMIADMIDGIYNVGAYGGSVAGDKGKTRIEVFNEHLKVMRKPECEDDLNLLLMRSSKPQMIKRNGVSINIAGAKLEYWDLDTWQLLDKKVYVRYDPENLNTVRIYDAENDKYIKTLPMAAETTLMFNDSNEKVAIAQSKVRSVHKAIKGSLNGFRTNLPPEKQISILDMQIRRAHAGLENFKIDTPKTIEMILVDEEKPTYAIASGGDSSPVVIDIRKMNTNARKNKL